MMELAKILKKFIHTLNYLKKNMNTIMREIEGIKREPNETSSNKTIQYPI